MTSNEIIIKFYVLTCDVDYFISVLVFEQMPPKEKPIKGNKSQ